MFVHISVFARVTQRSRATRAVIAHGTLSAVFSQRRMRKSCGLCLVVVFALLASLATAQTDHESDGMCLYNCTEDASTNSSVVVFWNVTVL